MHRNFCRILPLALVFALTMFASIPFSNSVTWGANVTDKEYGTMNPNEMPLAMQKIALIAAFTASGDTARLKQVLVEGLEAGLTVNEIKEVLIHTYAYAGFPRALNGINAFISIIEQPKIRGARS